LNTYSGADIARYTSNGQWVITLRLKTAAEMNLFATSGLRVFVVNPAYPQWADGRLVNR
jgi:inhibitor of KinA